MMRDVMQADLYSSPLGKASTMSGIAPRDAVVVIQPLIKARSRLILKGGLHPVFLITPPNCHIEPAWTNYAKIVETLYREHPDAKDVAEYLGIEMSTLYGYRSKPPSRSKSSSNSSNREDPYGDDKEAKKVKLYRRFFTAVLLFTLIHEWPISAVTNLMGDISRGQLQSLQKEAAAFCGMTVVLCKKLNWNELAACLDDYSGRLNFGVRPDILPLVRLGPELITTARARHFFKSGVKSPEDIVLVGVEVIVKLVEESLPFDGIIQKQQDRIQTLESGKVHVYTEGNDVTILKSNM